MAARILTGDLVVVISGKDKGKTGKVLRVLKDEDKVVVQGIAVVKRHTKPNPKSPNGGIFEKEAAIHACKVMPVDPKTGKGTRVRSKSSQDASGKNVKVRIAAKSGEELPRPAAKAE
jgi:large subunit ribosomal protein L24